MRVKPGKLSNVISTKAVNIGGMHCELEQAISDLGYKVLSISEK